MRWAVGSLLLLYVAAELATGTAEHDGPGVVPLNEEDMGLESVALTLLEDKATPRRSKSKPIKLPSTSAMQKAAKAGQKAAVASIKKEKLVDAAVRKKVAQSLDKQMAAQDAAATKISKADLAKEVAKLSPGFEVKQEVAELKLPSEARKQARTGRMFKTSKRDKLIAKSQAGVLRVAKARKPLPSMKNRVKAEEAALSASDKSLLHVSKAELAKEMAKISGAKKNVKKRSGKATATSSEVDRMQKAIKHAMPVGVADHGNPFHLTKSGKKLIVKRPIIKKLSAARARKASAQTKAMKLTPGQKKKAAQQAKTPYADRVTPKEKAEAKAQAKGMKRLHGSMKRAAKTQAKGLKLHRAEEMIARALAAGGKLSRNQKAK